jgi:hypothetical protein
MTWEKIAYEAQRRACTERTERTGGQGDGRTVAREPWKPTADA